MNKKLPFIVNYCRANHWISRLSSPYKHHLKPGLLSCNAPHIQYITMHTKARTHKKCDIYVKSANETECNEFRKAIYWAYSSMKDKCSRLPNADEIEF